MKDGATGVFRRKEKKYVLSREQYDELLSSIASHVEVDEFFESHIVSTYYDTDGYDIVLRSLAKPTFKEKIRTRSYGDGKVYVELKKKLHGTVYKRRIALSPAAASAWMSDIPFDEAIAAGGLLDGQEISKLDRLIVDEIDAYRSRFPRLTPAIEIYAHRFSYREKNGDARFTFDVEIDYRDLRTPCEAVSRRLTDDVVLEIKALGAYPLWLTHALSKVRAYPSSFSKYGKAYITARCRERLSAVW